MGSELHFQKIVLLAVMEQDWGPGKADPRFLARPLSGKGSGGAAWRWGVGGRAEGFGAGHAGPSRLGTPGWCSGQGRARAVGECLLWALDDICTLSSSRATVFTPLI